MKLTRAYTSLLKTTPTTNKTAVTAVPQLQINGEGPTETVSMDTYLKEMLPLYVVSQQHSVQEQAT